MSLWGAFMRLVLGGRPSPTSMAGLDQFHCIVLFSGDVTDTVGCLADNHYPVFLGPEP